MFDLSIVMPVLNEAEIIVSALHALEPLRRHSTELIVVDGGSVDATVELARPLAGEVIRTLPGRARQMNRGARAASGDYLLFLHADTRLPSDAPRLLLALFRQRAVWGRFDVRLSGPRRTLRLVEWLMNRRSRLTGIATGDQAIFVRRDWFETIGGYPEIPLMEDIALSARLKKIVRPVCLEEPVVTSSRRWEQRGVLRTVLLMWWLRLRFFFGADPEKLARAYSAK